MSRAYLLSLTLTLVLILMLTPATSTWTSLRSDTLALPAHVYAIECQAGQILSGAVRWNGTADLDAYLYPSGRRLMYYRDSIASYLSYSSNVENITYNVPTSGTYYLRVYAYSIGSTQPYTVDLSLSPNTTATPLTFTSLFSQKNRMVHSIPLSMPATNLSSIPIRYRITNISNPSVGLSMSLVSTGSSTVYSWPAGEGFCLPSGFGNGDGLSALFVHTVNNMTTLSQFSYVIETGTDLSQCNFSNNNNNFCYTGYYYDPQTLTCLPDNTIDNSEYSAQKDTQMPLMTRIIIGIVCSVIGVIILVSVGLCIYKKRRVIHTHINPLQIKQQQGSQQSLDSIQKDACSICLEFGCNAYLPCRHWFHYECVKAWYARNGGCPMCRRSFQGLKIIKREGS